jgi:hypothetical protein
MKPAANSAATDSPAIEPITIIRMHGGTRMPIAEGRHDRHRLLAAVAGADHRRDGGRCHGRDIGHRGSGYAGEDVFGHDHRHAQTATDPANQRDRQVDQPPRDAAGFHQGAGQDEQRNDSSTNEST